MHTFSVVAVRARRESPSAISATKATRSSTLSAFCGHGRSASDCESTPTNHGAISDRAEHLGVEQLVGDAAAHPRERRVRVQQHVAPVRPEEDAEQRHAGDAPREDAEAPAHTVILRWKVSHSSVVTSEHREEQVDPHLAADADLELAHLAGDAPVDLELLARRDGALLRVGEVGGEHRGLLGRGAGRDRVEPRELPEEDGAPVLDRHRALLAARAGSSVAVSAAEATGTFHTVPVRKEEM